MMIEICAAYITAFFRPFTDSNYDFYILMLASRRIIFALTQSHRLGELRSISKKFGINLESDISRAAIRHTVCPSWPFPKINSGLSLCPRLPSPVHLSSRSLRICPAANWFLSLFAPPFRLWPIRATIPEEAEQRAKNAFDQNDERARASIWIIVSNKLISNSFGGASADVFRYAFAPRSQRVCVRIFFGRQALDTSIRILNNKFAIHDTHTHDLACRPPIEAQASTCFCT